MEAANSTDEIKAKFLIEQVLAYGKKDYAISRINTRYSLFSLSKAPAAYSYMRDLEVLHLPHRTTLKIFIGHVSGEDSETSNSGITYSALT